MTTKSIFHSLLIEHLQASIWRELLMFTVLIGLYRAFRVTLAALHKVHKFNLAPFFCNYVLTLSPTLKFHDLGTKACQ